MNGRGASSAESTLNRISELADARRLAGLHNRSVPELLRAGLHILTITETS